MVLVLVLAFISISCRFGCGIALPMETILLNGCKGRAVA
jgi:hypothetical protein